MPGLYQPRPNQWPADGSLPDHVKSFCEFALQPNHPPYKQWANENGFGERVVYNWLKDKRVKQYMEERAHELNVSPERIQDVVNAMHRAAVGGDTKAAALYLQYIEKLAPKRIRIEDETLGKLSDEEFAKELAKLNMLDD